MKWALVTFGNEESYGLLFVGGELLEHGQDIKYFDGEIDRIFDSITKWNPDFIMFSPMTTFYDEAWKVAMIVKIACPNVISVFGGHHVMSSPNIITDRYVDITVIGPVRGSIEQIMNGVVGQITTVLTTPLDLPMPAREQYYRDIPRMGKRYRKFMLALFGCPYSCAYCSSSSKHMKSIFGNKAHKRYYLHRRSIDVVLEEAREIVKYPTKEIEWVDDDVFSGVDIESWMLEFVKRWKKEINLPMYVSATSLSTLKVSDKVLRTLRGIVNVVGLGVQAGRKSSLKLFNRSWDSEEKIKAAYDRLRSFGYSVNLQCIVGLPLKDPVEDALDTIKCMQRIGAGSTCSCYPLMIYPGTELSRYCKFGGVELNDTCNGDTNSAITGIKFPELISKQLRNICKLATLFVKYNIDEHWMRALINVDLTDEVSKQLSSVRYRDCIVDRLKNDGETVFEEVIRSTKLRY